ncbi:MAG: Hpt domain-containing protein [Methylotetracoccus sp.]
MDRQSPIDWMALEQRYQGRAEFIGKLAEIAIRTTATKPEALRMASERRDFASITMLAHDLKSMGGNLSAPVLEAVARDTENLARRQLDAAFARALDLAAELDALRSVLAERFG